MDAREDFPVLGKKINGKQIVYLDSACTTLRPVVVVEAMNDYYNNYPACSGRSVHKFAQKTAEEYSKARMEISKFIGSKKPEEIIFTRNTTEGLNLVIKSLGLKKGDTVITTDKEHNSNLLPIQMAKEKIGIKHKIIFSKKDGAFGLEAFMSTIGKGAKLVSMVHTSNIDGCTIPAKEIIKIAHDHGALVMLDGAQSVPHMPVDVKKLDCDFLAFSGHKMLGPSGTGVLYGKYELLERLDPFLVGGDTVKNTTYGSHEFLEPPEKFEAGLQNYAGAIGLAAAARYLKTLGMDKIEKHEVELNRLATKLLDEIVKIKILGPSSPEKRGGIIPFVVEGVDIHEVALMLDSENVMIRSGQHCAHSWFNAHKMKGSDRASLYVYNDKNDIKIFVEALEKITRLV